MSCAGRLDGLDLEPLVALVLELEGKLAISGAGTLRTDPDGSIVLARREGQRTAISVDTALTFPTGSTLNIAKGEVNEIGYQSMTTPMTIKAFEEALARREDVLEKVE